MSNKLNALRKAVPSTLILRPSTVSKLSSYNKATGLAITREALCTRRRHADFLAGRVVWNAHNNANINAVDPLSCLQSAFVQ